MCLMEEAVQIGVSQGVVINLQHPGDAAWELSQFTAQTIEHFAE
jgi:hypothetical protein